MEAAESRLVTPRDFLRALRQRLDQEPLPDWPSLQSSEAIVRPKDGLPGLLSRTVHPLHPTPAAPSPGTITSLISRLPEPVIL